MPVMTNAPPRPHKTLHGRRRGKSLSPAQRAQFERVFPRVRLDLTEPADEWRARVSPEPAAPLHLEIGFGGGEHLIHRASAAPGCLFIGCEPFVNGVAKALGAIETRGLTNVFIHDHDARDVLDWLQPATVQVIDILYPDPWPKKRHVKRRLLTVPIFRRLADVAAPGAQLRIATDITDYVRTLLMEVDQVPEWDWTARSAVDWRTPFPGWPSTRYEAKALREGRRPHYLSFVRRA